MSVNGSNGSQVGHEDDIGNLNDVQEPSINGPHLMEGVGCANLEEVNFKALYNKEVNFLANQGGGYRSNYPRHGGNEG
uniref:Uncharacterized protein n=1 Tax=Solanum tuberosum TaxID=4113 RepID=M1DC62_SOLTU